MRDQYICDACLDGDYDTRVPPLLEMASFGIVLAICINVAMLLWIVGVRPFGWSFLPAVLLLAVPGTLVLSAIIRLLLPRIMRAKLGLARPSREEQLAEAERFYWLARWAAIKGNKRFERKMLKQARNAGYRC